MPLKVLTGERKHGLAPPGPLAHSLGELGVEFGKRFDQCLILLHKESPAVPRGAH